MIRTYIPADLEALKQITITCFEGVSIDHNIDRVLGNFGARDWKWRKARHIDEDVNAQPDGVFVWEEDGEPIGYITARVDEETKIGWIPNLAVLPGNQGKGIGKALMAAALDYFEEKGMAGARIETLDQNNVGQEFYPRSGFTEIARQIYYVMPLGDRKV